MTANNTERIEALSNAINLGKEDIFQQGDSDRWYETTENRVYRVLTEPEIKEECIFEIKECWHEWRYQAADLSEFLKRPFSYFREYMDKDGWIMVESSETVANWITEAGEEQFAEFMFKKLRRKNQLDWLLDKVNDKAKIIGEYTIFQWA